jgi:hypothetical protein
MADLDGEGHPELNRSGPRNDQSMNRTQKITFGEMRAAGVRGVVVYCSDYKCGHSITMDSECWPDSLRLSDIEERFVSGH